MSDSYDCRPRIPFPFLLNPPRTPPLVPYNEFCQAKGGRQVLGSDVGSPAKAIIADNAPFHERVVGKFKRGDERFGDAVAQGHNRRANEAYRVALIVELQGREDIVDKILEKTGHRRQGCATAVPLMSADIKKIDKKLLKNRNMVALNAVVLERLILGVGLHTYTPLDLNDVMRAHYRMCPLSFVSPRELIGEEVRNDIVRDVMSHPAFAEREFRIHEMGAVAEQSMARFGFRRFERVFAELRRLIPVRDVVNVIMDKIFSMRAKQNIEAANEIDRQIKLRNDNSLGFKVYFPPEPKVSPRRPELSSSFNSESESSTW